MYMCVYVVDPQVSWFGFTTFVKIPLYLHLFVVVLPLLLVVVGCLVFLFFVLW